MFMPDHLTELLKNNRVLLTEELPARTRGYAIARERGENIVMPTLNDLSPRLSDEIFEALSRTPFLIRDLLYHDIWPLFIMASYFTINKITREPLLNTYFPMFGSMDKITRTANNLYKKDGWGLHVIIGLYVSNECIPHGEIPIVINHMSKDYASIFENLRKNYKTLERREKVIFRLSTLFHDLAVVEGVQEHDINGGKYVDDALVQLGITKAWWYHLTEKEDDYFDLCEAIKLFVENHALPSKFFGEYGLRELQAAVQKIVDRAHGRHKLTEWLKCRFGLCLSLFLIGDVMAIRDEYLTPWKIRATMAAARLIGEMAARHPLGMSTTEYGAERLCEPLELTCGEDVVALFNSVVGDKKWATHYLTSIGALERMDYSLAMLRQLPDRQSRIVFLCRLISSLEDVPGWSSSEWQEVRFSPNVSVNWIRQIVVNDQPEAALGLFQAAFRRQEMGSKLIIHVDSIQ